jgi:hypothetical protein
VPRMRARSVIKNHLLADIDIERQRQRPLTTDRIYYNTCVRTLVQSYLLLLARPRRGGGGEVNSSTKPPEVSVSSWFRGKGERSLVLTPRVGDQFIFCSSP